VSFFYGLNVLVTGGYGLMGTPLVKMLEDQGANVSIYDKRDGHDINSLSHVSVAAAQKDIIFHLAAVSGVEASRQMGYNAWYVNTFGTINVLEAARRNNSVRAVVVASSNHVYGPQDVFPVPEEAPMRQLDTYSATKIAADYMARSYHHNYNVPAVVMRNTNCYGPDDPHLDHIIPSTIMSVLDGERPVIHSTGLTSKSYLYVDDVAQAYLDAAQWSIEYGVFGEAYNVSTQPITSLDMVRLILNVMEKGDVNPRIEKHPTDQSNEYMDDSKLRNRTGWYPKVSLQDGLARTVEAFTRRYAVKA